MRRTLRILMPVALALALWLGGCAKHPTDEIYLISREDGSGTRSAFSQLTGVLRDGHDGLSPRAEITNSTSVVMLSVAGSRNAIGYISLGSLSDRVAALRIDGVAPTPEHVLDGSYPISRPFLLVTKGAPNPLAADFIAFIGSNEGQAVISGAGYAAAGEGGAYEPLGLSGTLAIDGSTSVAPVMELLSEAYQARNPQVTVELQQSGSSAGISAVQQGVCDIGMSSRLLSDTETEGLESVTIAMDAIAVIVSPDNPLRALTLDQVRAVFTGELDRWGELEEGGA